MAELILHHYPMSPFAEKVRLMLGYKAMAWRSVIIPSIMPKPDVVALTGGYRKTPFLQIGSHIYCDTALIVQVLERLAPTPTLFPPKQGALALTLAQWADEKLFWASMGYNFQPKGVAQVFGGGPPEQWADQAKVFAEDRSKMRSGMPRMSLGDATSAYKTYLNRFSQMLEEQDYLLGDAPCIADFSVYHALWFTRVQVSALAGVLEPHAKLLAWMDRMAGIGHGRPSAMSASEAIAHCAAAAGQGAVFEEESFRDNHGLALGSQVTIASEGFGTEPTQGELIGAGRGHYSLRRQDERAGSVCVHFPRLGFQLKAAAP